MRPSFFQEILSGGNVRNRSLNVTALALAIAAGALSPTDAFGQKKQRDLITREEIESVTQSSADLYEVVRKLRPQFLEPPKGQRTMPAGMRWDTRRDVGGSSGIAAITVARGSEACGAVSWSSRSRRSRSGSSIRRPTSGHMAPAS